MSTYGCSFLSIHFCQIADRTRNEGTKEIIEQFSRFLVSIPLSQDMYLSTTGDST